MLSLLGLGTEQTRILRVYLERNGPGDLDYCIALSIPCVPFAFLGMLCTLLGVQIAGKEWYCMY